MNRIKNIDKMKQTLFTIVALSLFLLGSCNRTKETVITGQIIGNADKVVYSNPNQGTCFSGFRDTIQVDENGNFELRFNLKRPSFIQIWSSEPRKECKLLLEPDNNYNILIDTEKGIEIFGANEAGQRLYSALPNPSFIEMQIGKDLREENSLTAIRGKIQDMKSEELAKFKKLLDENKITSSFFELIQKDRDCYFASLESRISQIKIYALLLRSESEKFILENGDDLLENLKNIYAQYSLDNKDILISSFWFEYAQNYIRDYVQFSKEDFNMDSFRELYNNGTIHTFIISEAKKHLTGKFLEFCQATYLYFTGIQKKFEKELIALFEQFKKDYPNSEYAKYIQPYIDVIVDFYNKVDRDFSENITFVENFENINTLEELFKPMKGKKIYVDVWATWCVPCKEEFKHSERLKQILKEKDIQMLYISIDREIEDAQWKNLIKYYNLEGKHIRVNENLKNKLHYQYDEKSGMIVIPWYILIDEEGNILQKQAKRPSQIVLGEDMF